MRRRLVKKAVSLSVAAALAALTLTGCRFGFASDPDDPNETEKEEPIDTSVDSFQYDASLNGTNITLLNSKGEIQVALEKMADAFEEKSGVHVEVMPVTEGDSPYTKVVSLYNSGTPPTLSILFLTLSRAFMVYDVNLSLTAGAPYGTTEMAAMHVYEKAFTSRQFGVGQAEALILFVIVACISGLQVYLTKKKEVEA